MTYIPGAKPSLVEGIFRLLFHLVVAFHDIRSLGQYFTVFCDFYFDFRSWLAHGPESHVFKGVDRDEGRCFGQPVSFEDD